MGFYWNKGKDILGPVFGTIAIVLAATAPYLILIAIINISIYSAIKEDK